MDNLTIGNTFKFFFVQKSNEKYYEEVFNKAFILIYVLSRSSRSQVFFKIEFQKKKKKITGKHLCWSLFLIEL